MLIENPSVSFPYFPREELWKSRSENTCHNPIFLLIVGCILHVEEMRPVEMFTLKREWGEGFLTTGLCSDVFTISHGWSFSRKSELHAFPFHLPGYLMGLLVCLEVMSLSIKNAKDEQDQQWPAQTLKPRQPTTVCWADLFQIQKFKDMADALLQKNTFTTQLTFSVFWHSFPKEMLKAKKDFLPQKWH